LNPKQASKKRKAGSTGGELKGRIKSKEAYMLIYKRREVINGTKVAKMEEEEEEVDPPAELADPVVQASEGVVASADAEKALHRDEAAKRAAAEQLREDIFHR
jgi:hypothetical protein